MFRVYHAFSENCFNTERRPPISLRQRSLDGVLSGNVMRYFKILTAVLLVLLLTGCSKEKLVEKGVDFLDKMFTANLPGESAPPDKEPPSSEPSGGSPVPEEPHSPGAVEPTIPDHSSTPEPAPAEPAAPDPEPPQTPPDGSVTPSHTDITFFGPGESFKYVPKGASGTYACTYTSENEAIATVDQTTGKVTAVGPGTTKVKMHVECGGQYDFECIVRCSWKNEDPQPTLPDEPADAVASGITASHSDVTFFNPKEHIRFLPVGAGNDIACSYTTGDAQIASVDDSGVITAVGPGTTTVTMTLDAGGTEYQFDCIVRCRWN